MDETTLSETTQPSDSQIPQAKKAYSRTMLNLALYEIIALVVIILAVIIFHVNSEGAGLYLLNFIPLYCIAFPAYLLLSKPLEKSPPERTKLKPLQFLMLFPCCQCFAILGNLLGIIVNIILTALIGTKTASTFLTEGAFGENSLLFISIAVLLAPAIEEMLFRKILIDRIRKYGNVTAILLSGIMFGLFHGNFTQVFYAALLGILFAYIYVKTGNILYTIGLHIMVNFWGTAVPALAMRNVDMQSVLDTLQEILSNPMNFNATAENLSAFEKLGPLLIFGGLNYALALAGAVILILNRKKIHVDPAPSEIPKGKRFSTACLNVGFLVFFCVCVFKFFNQIFGFI